MKKITSLLFILGLFSCSFNCNKKKKTSKQSSILIGSWSGTMSDYRSEGLLSDTVFKYEKNVYVVIDTFYFEIYDSNKNSFYKSRMEMIDNKIAKLTDVVSNKHYRYDNFIEFYSIDKSHVKFRIIFNNHDFFFSVIRCRVAESQYEK